MKSFIDVELVPTILHVIEEALDFNGFIAGFITEGDDALEGQTKAQ